MNWKLIDSRNIEAHEGEYTLTVRFDGKIWLWAIIKDGKTVDCVYYHAHTPSGEIDARVKAEKVYNALVAEAIATAPEVVVPIENVVESFEETPGGGEARLDAPVDIQAS